MNVTVLHVKRLKNSTMGNPTWELAASAADGVEQYRTQANSQTAYYIGQWVEGHDVSLEMTKAGTICGLTDLGK